MSMGLCPKCGGKAKAIVYIDAHRPSIGIACTVCGHRIGGFDTVYEAEMAWNAQKLNGGVIC